MKMNLRSLCLMLSAGIFTVMALTPAQAQESPRVGFKGGLNLSNLYVDDVSDENARVGFHAGIFTQLLSSEAFAIQPEINYSTKGTAVTYVSGGTNSISVDHDQRFNLAYLDIPVLAVFKLGRAAEIHAGPYWSYLLRAEIKNRNGNVNNEFTTIDRDNFDDWDYGLVGGIGFNLGSAAQLGVRYNYGLNNIADSRGAKALLGSSKNQVAQLYLAFNLNANNSDLDD